jgi:pantoate--beta-alanine ligase
VTPDVAIFGQKDYQQLRVVTQMARDLDLPLKVIGIPTVRERDGLALSSRNAYLSQAERTAAPALARVLNACASRIGRRDPIEAVLSDGVTELTRAGFTVDYLEARHALTLAPVVSLKDGPIRLLAAAKLGKTRLIDNLAV